MRKVFLQLCLMSLSFALGGCMGTPATVSIWDQALDSEFRVVEIVGFTVDRTAQPPKITGVAATYNGNREGSSRQRFLAIQFDENGAAPWPFGDRMPNRQTEGSAIDLSESRRIAMIDVELGSFERMKQILHGDHFVRPIFPGHEIPRGPGSTEWLPCQTKKSPDQKILAVKVSSPERIVFSDATKWGDPPDPGDQQLLYLPATIPMRAPERINNLAGAAIATPLAMFCDVVYGPVMLIGCWIAGVHEI